MRLSSKTGTYDDEKKSSLKWFNKILTLTRNRGIQKHCNLSNIGISLWI